MQKYTELRKSKINLHLLGTHLPSETRGLANKVDEALRKAWASLGDILGSDSFTEANADHRWQTFFNF